jgi:hypothetical protein
VGKRAGEKYYKVKKLIYGNDLNDSWAFPSLPFDRVIALLSDKLPKVNGAIQGQVVFLSGDVHFSFASRLAYWAELARYGDPSNQGQKASVVFAQLVCSSLKNEKDDTVGMQTTGYGYVPKKLMAYVAWSHAPTGHVGYNLSTGKGPTASVPSPTVTSNVGRLERGLTTPGVDLPATSEDPTVYSQMLASNNISLSVKPDWRYRLDYLPVARTGQTNPPAAGLPGLSGPGPALKSYAASLTAHTDLIDNGAKLVDAVGHNNIGEIAFVWKRSDGSAVTSGADVSAATRRVVYTVRWHEPTGRSASAPDPTGLDPTWTDGAWDLRWAAYDISLNIGDAVKIKADSEPTP